MDKNKITPEKRKRMARILNELRRKMDEIDRLKAKIERETPKPISAEEARAMLEEIKVPPLEIIKESRKK